MADRRPRAPASLGAAGRALWRDTVATYQLQSHELRLLESACGTVDAVAALEAVVEAEGYTSTGSKGQRTTHPAVPELRQQRLALTRIIAALALPDPDGGLVRTPQRISATAAAQRRWRAQRRREGA